MKYFHIKYAVANTTTTMGNRHTTVDPDTDHDRTEIMDTLRNIYAADTFHKISVWTNSKRNTFEFVECVKKGSVRCNLHLRFDNNHDYFAFINSIQKPYIIDDDCDSSCVYIRFVQNITSTNT